MKQTFLFDIILHVKFILKESGPTFVGDEWSEPKLMEYLGATKMKALGNNFTEWRSEDCARVVLNKLEKKGYKVVSMTGVGQTCIWTLNKPEESTS
ncbi:Hypothetical predicted protein [Mytilus galloprovincialis]|uniref:GTP cyclohydrolase 1 feedback regulatory protein n=1 Tax=Mytilus galloprovincialis TaxID=29158 RepID=A0A8B6FVR1_MYTGA|nr:Hypothetical predicted protein [Mytilus galloprovincialis]